MHDGETDESGQWHGGGLEERQSRVDRQRVFEVPPSLIYSFLERVRLAGLDPAANRKDDVAEGMPCWARVTNKAREICGKLLFKPWTMQYTQ